MNDMTKTKVSAAVVANDPRWARILSRDKTADGRLWYSVSTTGVYCRPSCPSRTANPKNVTLHDLLDSARATGFRPCKRCNPEGRSLEGENAALVANACRIIEKSEEEPSLETLAQAVGRSASYFHRVFKATTGLTPKDYAAADRAKKVRAGLDSGNSVTEAIYDAGFNSSGRFYEKSTEMLGMTPTKYRSGGANEEIKFAVGQTSLGAILVASSKKGVASILLGDDPEKLVRNLQDRFPHARLIGADRRLRVLDCTYRRFRGKPSARPGFASRCSRNGISAACLAGLAGGSGRRTCFVFRNRSPNRIAERGARRRRGLRGQQPCRCHSLPSGGPQRRSPLWLRLGS